MEYYKNLGLTDINYINQYGVECTERWEDIPNYENYYKISNLGRAKSLNRIVPRGNHNFTVKERILKQNIDSDDYLLIGVIKNGKEEKIKVHRLVAIMFILNPYNKPEVNHMKNKSLIVNKKDNRFWMLEWNTSKENMQNALKDGLIKLGQDSVSAKLTEEQVLKIREIGKSMTLTELSLIYDVSITAIRDILKRNKWKHI